MMLPQKPEVATSIPLLKKNERVEDVALQSDHEDVNHLRTVLLTEKF
jgi:hypothetical protein